MKKITKLLIGTTALATVTLVYKQRANQKKHELCQQSIANASQYVPKEEKIVGTWIDMTPQLYPELGNVFVGGITTDQHTYDFITEATTASMILFEKQSRL